jgi:hypothetical protein
LRRSTIVVAEPVSSSSPAVRLRRASAVLARTLARRADRLRGSLGRLVASRLRRLCGDAGMTTAEYAIGTLAACGFAALLVTILRSGTVRGLLLGLITKALALGG